MFSYPVINCQGLSNLLGLLAVGLNELETALMYNNKIKLTIKNIVFLLWKHDFEIIKYFLTQSAKDKTENLKKCGTVYHIHCDQCNKQHIGETSRVLETRIKEHLSRDSSAVREHCQLTGNSVDSSKTKVLATESNTFKRRIREAIEIRLRKPSLNRDNGFELANIYNTILGPLRPL